MRYLKPQKNFENGGMSMVHRTYFLPVLSKCSRSEKLFGIILKIKPFSAKQPNNLFLMLAKTSPTVFLFNFCQK